LETGIGPGRAEVALSWLLNSPTFHDAPYRPAHVISAGFSGALDAGCQIGDVILATEVVNLHGNRWPATKPMAATELSLLQGRLLAAPHLVTDPGEKIKLGQQHAARAVDMETATVARMCSQHGVPFACVRVISDEVHTALSPCLVSLLSGGRVAPLRVLAALVASPRLAGELWMLAKHTRRAAQQLGKALAQLLATPVQSGDAATRPTPVIP
jgi:adenosylhomocysteine nucleosidase